MTEEMTTAEKKAARKLIAKVVAYLGLKVVLYVGIHLAVKRLLKNTESDIHEPFEDELVQYAEKDAELIKNTYRPFVVNEDGNLGGLALFEEN